MTNLEAAKLSFYRNNISHLLIFESLICGFFQYQKEIVKEDLLQSIKMIYPFLKEEFFLKWDEADLDQLINLKLNKLINKNLMLHSYKIKFMINNIQYNFKANYSLDFKNFIDSKF